MKCCLLIPILFLAAPLWPEAPEPDNSRMALIRDLTTVEGVRDNLVIGYGIVAGLKGTGDKQQTIFTTQTLANMLQRMGVHITPTAMIVKNVAAVFVTATLPPFADPGMHLDVTVSSVGDAKSLEGGMLLLTPLYGADGQVYAEAQGPLVLGGYREGGGANSKQLNHPTVGRIANGGLVERPSVVNLNKLPKLALLLNDSDYSTAEAMANAINLQYKTQVASVVDGREVDLNAAAAGTADVPALLARVENVPVEVHRRARVVVNERTGTVVMGGDVRLGAVSILHGNFSVEVTTSFAVSQPNPLSKGQTEVVPETTTQAVEAPAQRIELGEGASVEQLVNGLQRIGATARDVIAILQAIKAAGALEADLEVI